MYASDYSLYTYSVWYSSQNGCDGDCWMVDMRIWIKSYWIGCWICQGGNLNEWVIITVRRVIFRIVATHLNDGGQDSALRYSAFWIFWWRLVCWWMTCKLQGHFNRFRRIRLNIIKYVSDQLSSVTISLFSMIIQNPWHTIKMSKPNRRFDLPPPFTTF